MKSRIVNSWGEFGPFHERNQNYTGILYIKNKYYDITYRYLNGVLHHKNKPAVLFKHNDHKAYMFNGIYHRFGGPAVYNDFRIINNKSVLVDKQYYIFGKEITKEQHDLLYALYKIKNLFNTELYDASKTST